MTVTHHRHPLAVALVTVPCATIVLCGTPQVVAAQNAQPYAAQLSALFTTIRAGSSEVAGAGVEVQQRFNRLYATEAIDATPRLVLVAAEHEPRAVSDRHRPAR
jgi:hypothetical protein